MPSRPDRWRWLADLVQLEAARRTEPPEASAPPRAALVDALDRLGFPADEVIDGFAAVLATTPGRLRQPDASIARHFDAEHFAVVLDVLLLQHDARSRAIATAWLACPPIAYLLPPRAIARWLHDDGVAGRLLAPRLPEEGLALLGPEALRGLAERATDGSTRAAASAWLSRLQ